MKHPPTLFSLPVMLRLWLVVLFCTGVSVIKADRYIVNDDWPRMFKGYFPSSRHIEVTMKLTYEAGVLKGILKYDNEFGTRPLEGKMDTLGWYKLYELDNEGYKTGAVFEGTITPGKIAGTRSYNDNSFEFELLEVLTKTETTPQNDVGENKASFRQIVPYFDPLILPMHIKFDKENSLFTEYAELYERPVNRVGTTRASLSLSSLSEVLKKVYLGGMVQFEGGCTGLFIHVYCESPIDGNLYATYCYIYNNKEEFVQAFVVYEAMDMERPILTTSLSRSKIFVINDLIVPDPQTFRIGADGEIDFVGDY